MKIAFLATGDELITGDILNTNGQIMAQTLFDKGYHLGQHILVADDETEIIRVINFLLAAHEILIITGGLGPTSDDKTRFALAKALDKELIFDDASWDKIGIRLKKYKLQVHQSNRQQALFPQGANIIVNPNGTANGCVIEHKNKIIFMLPGPPAECLPMFRDAVLPLLQQKSIAASFQNFKWRLFGVSEGEIAAELDKLVEEFNCITGYRWNYPYLEFKIRLPLQINAQAAVNLIEKTIKPYVICTPQMTASELLISFLSKNNHKTIFCDKATGGLFEYTLRLPELKDRVIFIPECLKGQFFADFYFEISGLEALWQNNTDVAMTEINLKCYYQNKSAAYSRQIPFRSRRVVDYAIEYLCYEILKFIQEITLQPFPLAK